MQAITSLMCSSCYSDREADVVISSDRAIMYLNVLAYDWECVYCAYDDDDEM